MESRRNTVDQGPAAGERSVIARRSPETSPEVMVSTADLATDDQLGIWEAVILSAASQLGCRLLLSENFIRRRHEDTGGQPE